MKLCFNAFSLVNSFLNPNGNKLVVVKVTILVTSLGHVVILGYIFIETLKVLSTLNISRPPWTRKKMILLKLTTRFLWKLSEMLSISYKTDSVHIVEGVIKPIENLRVFSKSNNLFCSTIFWFLSMKGYEATDWSGVNSSLCFHLNNTNNVVITVECLYYGSKRPTNWGSVVFFDDNNIVHSCLYVFCPPFVPLLKWR